MRVVTATPRAGSPRATPAPGRSPTTDDVVFGKGGAQFVDLGRWLVRRALDVAQEDQLIPGEAKSVVPVLLGQSR